MQMPSVIASVDPAVPHVCVPVAGQQLAELAHSALLAQVMPGAFKIPEISEG